MTANYCTISDTNVNALSQPSGAGRPIAVASTIVPLFVNGTLWNPVANAQVQTVIANDGTWSVNLPYTSICSPNTVQFQIILPDGTAWTGTVPSVAGPLTLHDLKVTYSWAFSTTAPVSAIGGVTGPAGPAGATGPTGPTGPSGSSGITNADGTVTVAGTVVSLALGHANTFTAAQTLPLIDHGGQAYNIVGYGADPTGSVDATSIINALGASGRVIFIPQGATIKVTQLLFTSLSDLVITGGGSIVGSSGATQPLMLSGCTRVKVLNVNVSHGTPGTRGQGHGIYLYQCTDFEVAGCEVTNTNAIGINSSTGLRGSIHNNIVHDNQADGIGLYNGNAHVQVFGNTLYSTGDDAISVVSYRTDSTTNSDVSITGNTVYESRARGIIVSGGSEIVIGTNVIDATTYAGIFVGSESGGATSTRPVTDVVVVGNTVLNPNTYNSPGYQEAGIDIAADLAADIVDGVLIVGNTVRGSGYMGIRAFSNNASAMDHLTIEGNQIVKSTHHGIQIDANCLTGIVRNNGIYLPNQGNTGGIYGILNQAVAGFTGFNTVIPDGGKTALTANQSTTNTTLGTDISGKLSVTLSQAQYSGGDLFEVNFGNGTGGNALKVANDGTIYAAGISIANYYGNGEVRLCPTFGSINNGLNLGWDGTNTSVMTVDGSGANQNWLDDSAGNMRIKGSIQVSRAAHISSGTGAPSATGSTAGDIYHRTDTPTTANQRMYICTVTGTTWVGVV